MTLILLPNLLSAEASIERSFPPALAEEVKRLSDGTGIVPILVEGDKVKVGFGGG